MEKKRPQGRPEKWTVWVAKMQDLLEEEHPVGLAVCWTDEQVFEEVNCRLPEEHRIDIRTFQRWKAGEIDDEVGRVFMSSYKRSLRTQGENLLKKLSEDVPGGWQKWAWIIERKFDEWNIRQKVVDETPAPKQLVFTVLREDEDI